MSWFTKISSFVDEITEGVLSTASKAQEEILAEQMRLKEEEDRKQNIMRKEVILPWETEDEAKAILSQALMEEILALSLCESNFSVNPPLPKIPFYFQDFIPVAKRLLSIDSNLSRMYAKLSPKLKEDDFWYNYYYRITFLRVKIGIEENTCTCDMLKSVKEGDVIYNSNSDGAVKASTSNNDLVDQQSKDDSRRLLDAQLIAEVEAELDNDLYLEQLDKDLDLNIDEFEILDVDYGSDIDQDIENAIALELNNENDEELE